eukprot:TRINITY_DN11563_c0_g1_i2.p1 TRINITY_DN11563_c0_g1~~TRINITY_DN11563_c0_g1_i2.p1  ORF type:complete len:320 (+),score=70.90 TRINITY_DN11563_c0_g1_i2:178-1137(+)
MALFRDIDDDGETIGDRLDRERGRKRPAWADLRDSSESLLRASQDSLRDSQSSPMRAPVADSQESYMAMSRESLGDTQQELMRQTEKLNKAISLTGMSKENIMSNSSSGLRRSRPLAETVAMSTETLAGGASSSSTAAPAAAVGAANGNANGSSSWQPNPAAASFVPSSGANDWSASMSLPPAPVMLPVLPEMEVSVEVNTAGSRLNPSGRRIRRKTSRLALQETGLGMPSGSASEAENETVTEEEWDRRHNKRKHAIIIVKSANDDWKRLEAARQAGEALGPAAPRTPDPMDRAISKRQWEQGVMNWRTHLRVWAASS